MRLVFSASNVAPLLFSHSVAVKIAGNGYMSDVCGKLF
jgi:hypothetical protein